MDTERHRTGSRCHSGLLVRNHCSNTHTHRDTHTDTQNLPFTVQHKFAILEYFGVLQVLQQVLQEKIR